MLLVSMMSPQNQSAKIQMEATNVFVRMDLDQSLSWWRVNILDPTVIKVRWLALKDKITISLYLSKAFYMGNLPMVYFPIWAFHYNHLNT